MMLWKKPVGMKFTDLCIYVDQNVPKIVNPGEFPEIENTIYNYLWLLVKALAIKKCMFNNFADYDPYAFYAANRLFFALRKNQLNQGQTIKGKFIKPIKSCLNYTKALLYPMKVEYQREAYKEILKEADISNKFDSFALSEQLKDHARQAQGSTDLFIETLATSLQQTGSIVDKVLARSPFTKDSVEYKRLKMSLMINTINTLKAKKKLDGNIITVVLWKLPKSMSNYVRILLKEFYTELKIEIMDCFTYSNPEISDSMLQKILSSGEEDHYED